MEAHFKILSAFDILYNKTFFFLTLNSMLKYSSQLSSTFIHWKHSYLLFFSLVQKLYHGTKCKGKRFFKKEDINFTTSKLFWQFF